MLDWLKQKFRGPLTEPVEPDLALQQLRMVASDAVFEEVWESMDGCAASIEEDVTVAIRTGQLGEYPMHAATIWLAYTLGASGRTLPEDLCARLEGSIAWAMGFDENTVLLGGALGALDAIEPPQREATAVRIFEDAGVAKPRRYWLLLKVRGDALMTTVVDALRSFTPPEAPDSENEEYVYTPTDANRMAGAFRQFGPADFELVCRHFDLASPGAQFLVEALGSTGPPALELLREAAADERPAVRDAAERWLRVLAPA